LASIALIVILMIKLKRKFVSHFLLSTADWKWGLLTGLIHIIAFITQVSGLEETSSNRNAFMTGLNVVIIPFIACLFRRHFGHYITWNTILGILLSVLGISALFYETSPWNFGDTLSLISAFFYAFFILSCELSATSKHPPSVLGMTLVMMIVMGLVSLGVHLIVEIPRADYIPLVERISSYWFDLLYLGFIASALAISLQMWAQKHVSAVEAAIVYSLEPVFASILAIFWIGEWLTIQGWFGAVLVVSGVVLSQIKLKKIIPHGSN
jgi:drug/metabolite transporter (DMT)-like permease